MAAMNFFNPFSATISAGIDLASDTFFVALFTAATAPTSADETYDRSSGFTLNSSGAAEVTGGGSTGYTQGGIQLTGTNFTESGGVATMVCTSSALQWTAGSSGFSFRYVVLWDSTAGTAAARFVVGWWDYGSTLSLVSGQIFSFTLGSGVLTLTN